MRWGFWLLLFVALWGSVAYLRPPSRQQELRVLITARNMVEAKDPLHFEFQNQPRYRKPPLAYWMASAGYLLTGQLNQAWAGRLLFVLIAVAGIGLFADLGGGNAAVLFAATFGGLQYVPLAETDMLQLSFMILAFWAWKKDQGILAGLGMACALLSKGPGGALIPILCFWILQRDTPRSIRFWVPSLLLPLAASVSWILFLRMDAEASTALAMDLHATFVNSAHSNPFPYYVWTLPLMMFPAVLYLGLFESKTSDARSKPAVVWFWVTFILLTLTVSKQRHYALMLLPPACWWLALHLPSWKPSIKRYACATLLFLLVSGGVFWFGEEGQHTRFLQQTRKYVPEQGTLHVVGINSARFDFHLGRHVENTDTFQKAFARAAPGDLVVVVQKAHAWRPIADELQPVVEADSGNWIRKAFVKGS